MEVLPTRSRVRAAGRPAGLAEVEISGPVRWHSSCTRGWSVTRTATLSWTPVTHSGRRSWCGTSQVFGPGQVPARRSSQTSGRSSRRKSSLVDVRRHHDQALFHRPRLQRQQAIHRILVPRVAAEPPYRLGGIGDHAALADDPGGALRTKAADHRLTPADRVREVYGFSRSDAPRCRPRRRPGRRVPVR